MTFRLLKKLLYAASPYLVIGILLMLYNYLRFDIPFEFGQSYQLTITDQSKYGNFFAQFDLLKMCNGIRVFLVSHTPMSDTFPYVSFNGILLNFPLLCFGVFGMGSEGVRVRIREDHIGTASGVFAAFLLSLPWPMYSGRLRYWKGTGWIFTGLWAFCALS